MIGERRDRDPDRDPDRDLDFGALPPLPDDAWVSVIIPARGAAALLPDCLASVLPQLRDDDELIVAAGDDAPQRWRR